MFHILVLSILLTSEVYDVGAVTLNASLLTQLGFNNETQYVDLFGRNIDQIDPNAFTGYSKVISLHLEYNSLSKIDLGVFKELVNLQILVLIANPLTQLTNSKKILFPFLQRFYISSYDLDLALDSNVVNAMPNLTFFQGSIKNQLKPNQLSIWKKLDTLLITAKNQTSLTKEHFNGLNSLTNLIFYDSNLETIEVHTLLALPNLTEASIGNTNVRSFEYLQIPEKLTVLYLGGNKMNYFMLSRTMGFLRKLSLNKNQFRSFKSMDFTFLANLTELDLGNNPHAYPYEIAGHMKPLVNLVRVGLNNLSIDTVDSSYFKQNTKLQTIYLTNNKISILPFDVFTNLKSLYILDLSNNQISALDNRTFFGLNDLYYIYFQGNQLTKIAPRTFHNLSSLSFLELSNNLISEIDGSAFSGSKSLYSINLANNRLSEIDNDTFLGLNYLMWIDLSSNIISTIKPGTFNNLKNLVAIKLHNNNLTQLDNSTFFGCNILQGIYLYNNPNLITSNLQSLCPTAATNCQVYF